MPAPPQPWAIFLRTMLFTLGAAVLLAAGLIVLMNPYGNLPVRAFGSHVIMDTNDRFQYPAIVRSRAFDSAVIGTSSARLLDPARLESAFGGRFANLSMNDGRAWEQYQLGLLFVRNTPAPKTLLFGLDWVWCAQDADVARISPIRTFPTWLYDDVGWNDWAYAFNDRALDTAVRQLGNHLGLLKPRFPPNGFDVFVPPESAYDAVKARRYIWGGAPRAILPLTPAHVASAAERAAWRYPAIAWLDELLEKTPREARKILAFMPGHINIQPQPGSPAEVRDQECKARIAKIATRHGADLVTFAIRSAITTNDAHYWDAMHYRLPIAQRIIDGIAKAAATGTDDPGGDWLYLAGPMRSEK